MTNLPPAPAPNRAKQITLEQLVNEAYKKGFSDIHLGVGKIPCFRSQGQIVKTSCQVTDEKTFYEWMKEILRDADIEQFQHELDFDGAAQYEFTRVRINAFMTLKGPAMVLRLIPLRIKTLDEIQAPGVLKDLCTDYHQGLILVTGPTGSGKSTTLAAMIDHINQSSSKHIVTIEDPIEFVHQNHKSLVSQREVGLHTLAFERALKAVLREDPDIILIGEMRDRITVDTALKAAQTGHLVLGTLHTNNAVATIERLLNIYQPEEQIIMRMQLAEALVAVVAQALVSTTDGQRTAVHEVMVNTDTIKDWIQRGEVEEIKSIIPDSSYYGMQSMNQALSQLYQTGRITEETALSASPDPNSMMLELKGVIR
jgi:twitching motility protein PilT